MSRSVLVGTGARLRVAAIIAAAATLASTLVFAESAVQPAIAAVSKANLVLSYDSSNQSSYPGSGSTITDLSGGGHTATFQGSASGTSSSFNFTAGANGTSYATIGGDLKGFENGLTVSFEGTLAAANNWERIISVGNVVPSSNGLYASGGDGFWLGRVDTSGELVIEGFNNTATTGQCRTSGAAADTSYARWTFTISSSRVCRIYKNGVELPVNINGGASSYGVTTGVALSSASHTVNYLGRSQWSGDSDLGGNIRWIKVYKTALSQSEITDEQTGIVTFDPNLGTGSMANQSSTSAATLSANGFTRPDFTFAGWNTAANGSGTPYSNGSTYSFSDDITLYAQWTPVVPTNSGGANAPPLSGTAKVGQTLTAGPGTWTSGTTPTYTYKWQRSADGLNGWTDISGATNSTYLVATADATNFIRAVVTATNTAGSSSAAYSAATSMVLSENSVTGSSGEAKSIGSMFSVPSGSTVYNVTLTSSNLSGAFSLGTTTGLTWVEGYSSTASYMPSSISGSGSIFSFRGTGDAINTALATLKYQSTSAGTDVLKMQHAEGSSTSYDIRNYIPIYDAAADAANRLTFHYYGLMLNHTGNATGAEARSYVSGLNTFTSLLADGTSAGSLTSPNNKWYLLTPRSAVERNRATALMGTCTGCWSYIGGEAAVGSSTWSLPAGNDGYSASSSYTPSPWYNGSADAGTTAVRDLVYRYASSQWQFDDQVRGPSQNGYLAETYSTTPISATASTQTFQALSPAEAPATVTVTGAGQTTAVVGWSVPTVNASTPITGYTVKYATNSSMSGATTINTGSTRTWQQLTGLTANTTYYVTVQATGAAWSGTTSSVVSGATKSSATTLTISTSGGVVGTDFKSTGGAFAPVGTSATVSVSDLQTALVAGDVILAADTVNIGTPVNWSNNSVFTIGNSTASTIAVNADVAGTGSSAGLNLSSAACNFSAAGTYTGCYSLDVKYGANIRMTGSSASVNIGGSSYAVINSKAALEAFGAVTTNADKKFVIGSDIDLSGTTYSRSGWSSAILLFGTQAVPSATVFSGVFDGLGNSIQNYTMQAKDWESGLFWEINGGTVRNLGLTNIAYTTAPSSTSSQIYLGGISGWAPGNATIDQVWVTGSITGTSGTLSKFAAGGIVGFAVGGTLNITRSWTSVAINASSQTTTASLAAGGIFGGTSDSVGGGGAGASVNIRQVYATGSINVRAASAWNGIGGIMGLNWTGNVNPTLLEDVFYWGNFTASVNHGGIIGLAGPGGSTSSTTITRAYTTYSTCTNSGSGAFAGTPTCTANVKPGTLSTYTGGVWANGNGTVLSTLATPAVPLYVVPTTPSDGSGGTVGYKIVDGVGTDVTATLGTTGYPTISGTAAWDTITASSPVGTYSVKYASGLTLSGTAATSYTLNTLATASSITLTKQAQSVSWSPTTSVSFGNASFTPSVLASASTAITYSVSSAGTSGCTVNSSTGVVSYTSGGTCSITATAANSGNYLGATKTVAFTISAAAAAPSTITVSGAGQTTAVVGWSEPTVTASTPVTGYTVKYSTSSSMAGATTINTGSTRTWQQLTGLTANTTYYVTVQANGTSWAGTTSAIVNGSTKSVATTLTISTSGGTAGTDFSSTGGAFTPIGAAATVSASDLQTALASGDVILAADTVTIATPVNWSNNTVLTVGNATASTIAINADLNASGTSGGLKLAGSSYALDTKTGANITLSGASSKLFIGGTEYTLIRSQADLANITSSAGTFWALANPITMPTTYTNSSPVGTLAGVFDGLGNTASGLTISPTATGTYGFFTRLQGATVRNFGVTNVKISTSTASLDLRLGALAGNGSNGGTTTITQVWASGSIYQGAASGRVEAGGLFGGALSGTLNISKAWSSVAVTTYAPTAGSGGIIGANVSTMGGGAGLGNTLTIDESYSTGNIYRSLPSDYSWYGNGGIIGVAYGVSTTIRNTFSWGNINSVGFGSGVSTGGIVGVVGGTTTVSNSYSAASPVNGNNFACDPSASCLGGQTPGSAVTGYSTGLWSTTNGASLTNLPLPTKLLYVKVTYSNTTGSYADLGYKIVDSTGYEQDTAKLTTLGLAVTGSPTYSIASNVAKGSYNVDYDSGLTLGGSSASVYSLQTWTTSTPATITRLSQTISWTPTTQLLRTDTGTTVAAATTTGDSTITYAVTSAGTTGCAINSSTRVLTFTAEGSCTITATAPQTTNYTTDSISKTFVISTAPPLAPSGLVVAGGSVSGQLAVSWAAPSASTTGGTIASYELEASTDGSTFTSVATGITATNYTATGLTNGTGVTYRVRAVNNLAQNSPWLTASTSTKPYFKPINLTAPVITGSAIGGLTLNASVGTWDDNGSAITGTAYQWQISSDDVTWTDITNATSSTYVPTAGQAGKYIRVKVTKTNAAGDTAAMSVKTSAVQSGLASAPTSLVVTRGNEQLNLTWVAPSTTNGGTIASYTVQYRASGGSWTTASSSIAAGATSYTITGLTNGTAFDVRVSASTAAGAGPEVTTAQTVTPANAPTNTVAPIISGLEAVGRSLSVTTGTWAANGNTITGYTYQWQASSNGTSDWANVSTGGTASTYVPTSAESGKYLRVVVGATNDVGTTTIETAVTDAVRTGLANAPTALTSTPGNARLELSWVAPDTLNGGAISDYEVQYSVAGANTWTTVNVGSATASITITGLTNATAYDLRVAGVTAAGSGAVASYTADISSTPFADPVNAGGNDLPVITGSPVRALPLSASTGVWNTTGRTLSYSYQWQVADAANGTYTDITSNASATTATFTPDYRHPGKFVRVVVTATNLNTPNGVSSTGTAISLPTTAIQTGLASAVQNLTVTRGDKKLSVTWQAPATTNGGTITSYMLLVKKTTESSYQIHRNALAPSTTSSETLATLTNGTSYDVRVLAVTAAGAGADAIATGTPSTVPTNAGGSNLPSVSGTTTVGETLTVSNGTWNDGGATATYSYQWQTSADGSTGWSDLTGETSSTYTLTASDSNQYLRAVVTATNAAGASTPALSAATTAVLGAPANTAAPVVSVLDGGTGGVGTRLRTTDGTWDMYGLSMTALDYQWQRSSDGTTWIDISGATSSVYTTVSADSGKHIRATVSVSSSGGTGTVSTRYTGSGTDGVIGTGIASAPRSLTATPTNGALQLEWLAPTALNGGEALRYVFQYSTDGNTWVTEQDNLSSQQTMYWMAGLTNGTAYHVRMFLVTGAGDGAATTLTSSAATTPFGAPINTTLPTISGALAVGETLSAVTGSWNNNGRAITEKRYQWFSSTDGSTFEFLSNGSTYTLTSAELGKMIRITEQAESPGGATVAMSASTAAISDGIAEAPTSFTATYSPTKFALVWAAPTALNGASGITGYRVQYSTDGQTWSTATDVLSASATGYDLTGLTVGERYLIRVSALTLGGTGTAAVTPNAVLYGAVPSASVLPSLTGTAAVLETLTATDGTWSGNGAAITNTTYQWQVSADGQSGWANITDATEATHTLTAADADQYLRVLVTKTNLIGSTTEASSASTQIGAGPASAPRDLTLTRTDLGLTANWLIPSALNGGTLADYTVQYSDDDGAHWVDAQHTASTATSISIAGLTEGSSYLVRVRAETEVNGTWATSSATTVIALATHTGIPIISGTPLLGQQLSATRGTWANHGAAITGYSYQWQTSANGSTGWADLAGATNPSVTISTANLYYRVLVRATNEAGTSSDIATSAPSAFTVTQRASQPTALSITPADHALLLSWQAPTELGGGTVSNYTVEYSTDADHWVSLNRSANTTTSASITGLDNGTPYYVRVAAETTVLGQYSITAQPVVPFGAPLNTVAPSVAGTVKYDATVAAIGDVWTDNGGTLGGKLYQWQSSNDSGQTWVDISGATSSSYRIGEIVGQWLRVSVTQTNVQGLSTTAFSAATVAVAAIAAGAPTIVSVTPGDQSIALTWSDPATWGGSVLTKYEVEYHDGSGVWQTVSRTNPTARTETISGLTNGVQYTLRVRTVTALNGGFALPSAAPYGRPLNTTAPSMTGTARYDETLSASTGAWDANGSTISATSYQWQYSPDGGTSWTDIPAATNSTYRIGTFVGKPLRVLVSSTNSAGTTTTASAPTVAVVAAAASAPTNLSITAGDTELVVRWNAPSYTGGSPVTDYQIEYSSDGNTWNSVTRTASTSTEQIITGLSNGTAYDVHVRALNGASGAWVWSSNATTPFGSPISTGLPTITGTLTYGSVLTASAGTFNENGRSVVETSYQWQYSTDGGSQWTPISGATSSVYAIGSHVGHTLRVVVSARNLHGTTSHASVTSGSVIADTASAPVNVQVESGDQQLALSWDAPTYLGGASITDYQIEYMGADAQWHRVSRAASVTRTQVITGLTNGEEYEVRVRALNGVDGAWQRVSAAGIPFGLPQVATAGTLPTISGNLVFGQTLTATNTVWNSNGSPITRTSVQWQVLANGTWIDIEGATEMTFTITGFIGKPVRAMVTVVNAAGAVDLASAQTAVIVAAQPASPTGVSAVADDQATTISWNAPTNTGGAAIVDYTVQYSTDGDSWSTVSRNASTATTQRIGSLANGTPYYVRVRAQNGVDGRWAFMSTSVVPRGLAVNVTSPSISGAAQFQGNLSVDDGVWNENGDSIDSFSYQWQYSSDNGQTWSNIAGATRSNYAVGLYVGSKIRAVVRATNDAGIQSTYSAATATVTAIPAATPVITSQQSGSGTVRVGWTPPVHSGGETLIGYTLQYSTDSSNWSTLSYGANDTTAALTGLTNGTGYFVRVRAETTQPGEWSPVAGPFTPVAPPAPVIGPRVLAPTAPAATSDVIAPLLTAVMPRSLTTTSITSLTGPSQVTVTEDGRIELQPTQSVALIDGQPVDATVQINNSSVNIKTDSTSLQLDFGSTAQSSASASTATTLQQGTTISFTGDGFGATTPVVTWIQSDPVKLSEAEVSRAGTVTDKVKIPSSIAAGEHTIQVNGLDTAGRVVSLIYGVEVTATALAAESPSTPAAVITQLWFWMLLLVVVAILAWVSIRLIRRRHRP